MEYNKLIAELHTGDDVEGFYVLKDAFLKTTAAGKPFLSGVLADRSGVIDLKVWDYSGPIGARPDDIGRVVKIRGQVSEFKGAPQLTAGRIRMADGNDQYDLSALVPTAPIDADARVAEIERMIDSMEDREYQSVARTMLARHLDAFRSIPAAKSVHHSFLSGLLMHTSNMLRLADFLAGLYGEIIDRSLLLTGTLLHDFAKEKEFTFSGLGLVTDYSLPGQLIGHLVMGAQEVQQCAQELGISEEKSLLLQHMANRSSARLCARCAPRQSCSPRSTSSTAAWRSTPRRCRICPLEASPTAFSRWTRKSTVTGDAVRMPGGRRRLTNRRFTGIT